MQKRLHFFQNDRPTDDLYIALLRYGGDHLGEFTTVDWLIGAFASWDFFAPWDNIEPALVATPAHDMKMSEVDPILWTHFHVG